MRNRDQNNNGVEELPVEEIITQEDGTIVRKTGDLIEEISPEEMERTKLEIEERLVEAESLNIVPEEGQIGTGRSYRNFDEGKYYQKIEVEGMTPLAKGYFYEVWLEDEAGRQTSIGRLEMIGSTGSLYYSTATDRSEYKTIVVSREIDDGNLEMGEIVLRGKYE